MRLIVVAPTFWSEDGTGTAVRELTRELVKLNVDLVSIIHADPNVSSVYEPAPERTPIFMGGGHHWFSNRPPFKFYLFSRRAAKQLKSMRRDYGDDCVIHSHTLFPSAFLGNNIEEKELAFVTTIHGTAEGEMERYGKEMPISPQELPYRLGFSMSHYLLGGFLKRSRGHFIALSPSNASELVRRGLPRSRVHIVPNGVDLNTFRPHDRDEARKRLKLPSERPITLTISAIDVRKGIHTLIRAAQIIINDQPDAYFVIVGKAARRNEWYLTYLQKLASKLRLDKHLKFTGYVPTGELPLYLSAADVFTLASYAEGAPLVIPQAMACGCVVIATQGAAAGYLPMNLVVESGNFSELAQRISFYLSHEKERRLAGDQLHNKATSELSWANVARKTLGLYRQVTNAR